MFWILFVPEGFRESASQAVERERFQPDSPLKQKQVEVIVALGEEVPQNTGGIAAADLIGRQPEVDALDKIPHLSDLVLAEAPTGGRAETDTLVLFVFFTAMGLVLTLKSTFY